MAIITEADLQSAIDLTIERLPEFFPIRPILNYKDIQRNGRANWKTNSITVPKWAGKIGESYALYYSLHELTHYVNGKLSGHGEFFKRMEDKILSLWGLSIKRAKCYPKELYANGQSQPVLKYK